MNCEGIAPVTMISRIGKRCEMAESEIPLFLISTLCVAAGMALLASRAKRKESIDFGREMC